MTATVPAPANPRPTTRSLSALALIVGLLTAGVHWPALSARALWIDDDQYLTGNPLVQRPSWNSARRFFTEVLSPSTVRGYYQPLTMVSLMLDRATASGPEDLAPIRRTSVFLHALNTTLVVLFFGLLLESTWPAALAGLLFGVHPVTVEITPWVAERKTLLATLFALLSLILYLRFVRAGRRSAYATSLATFGLALLAKPTAIPLPLLLLVLDWWPLRRLTRRSVYEKTPFFILAATFVVITLVSQTRTAVTRLPTEQTLPQLPLLLFHNLGFYAFHVLWPVGLSPFYPYPVPFDLSNAAVLTATVAGVGLCVVLWLARRRLPALWSGCLFAFFALLPTLGLIGFTTAVACDKYLYLPLMGLLLPLAALLRKLASAVPSQKLAPALATTACLAAAAALGWLTRGYLARWQDSGTLFAYALSRTPHSAVIHNNYGTWLAQRGRLEDALQHFDEALRLQPDYWTVRINRATALRDLGRLDEAIAQFRQFVTEVPHDPAARFDLANALQRAGHVAEACAEYAQAVRLDPRHTAAWTNWGILLLQNGQTDEAVQRLQTAVSLNPDDVLARFNLGLALAQLGRLAEAAEHYRHAARVDPRASPAYTNLGLVLVAQGRLQEAVDAFRSALAADPNDALAHLNLGTLAVGAGRFEAAESHFRAAVALDPNSAAAHNNLGALLVRQRRYDESIAPLTTAVRLNPDYANAHYLLGAALSALQRHEDALPHLRRAVDLQPSDREACEQLAMTCAAVGRFDEAIVVATRAIELARAAHDAATVARLEDQIRQWQSGPTRPDDSAPAATLPVAP